MVWKWLDRWGRVTGDGLEIDNLNRYESGLGREEKEFNEKSTKVSKGAEIYDRNTTAKSHFWDFSEILILSI